MAEVKTDCFAYHEDKNLCSALSELVCANSKKCAFYKHKSEVDFREMERAVKNYSGPAQK